MEMLPLRSLLYDQIRVLRGTALNLLALLAFAEVLCLTYLSVSFVLSNWWNLLLPIAYTPSNVR